MSAVEAAVEASERRAVLGLRALWLTLAVVVVGASLVGAANLSATALWEGLTQPSAHPDAAAIVWNIRLPRVALGVVVGAALAMSGAALQGALHNPLADPALTGVSSGAALGAGLWLAAGAEALVGLPLAALVGALLAVGLLSRLAAGASVATLALAGVALNAVFGAGLSLVWELAEPTTLRSLVSFIHGALGGASPREVGLVVAGTAVGLVAMYRQADALDALSLGERPAALLGVDARRVSRRVMVIAAATMAVSVPFTGVIGFVGLVVPHLARRLVGGRHRCLLPASGLAGACVVVLGDLLARTVVAPRELPLGLLTALVGAPAFVGLIVRRTGAR